jgi:NADH-quinone oxidoreductase subunit L
MAGTIGLVQNDIKRVLAYSTVSQLGYMFLAMGVGAFGAGIFHLYTHAFFKALLFLGSGAVIHALHGEQDIRNMGGLKKHLPITYWTFLIGSLAIAGVPGLAGFFSKDEILFETFVEGHTLLWVIGAITSLLTATYMFRLVFLTFHGERRHAATATEHPEEVEPTAHAAPSHPAAAPSHHEVHLHDAPPAMALALIVLALGSVVAGYIGVPHALGGHNQLATWLEPAFEAPAVEGPAAAGVEAAAAEPALPEEEDHTALELTLMAVSSGIAIAGIALAAFIWLKRRELADRMARSFGGIYRLLLNKYYVDEIYDAALIRPIVAGSREGLWKIFDLGVIDGLLHGIGQAVTELGRLGRYLQAGFVRGYAAIILFGALILIGVFAYLGY